MRTKAKPVTQMIKQSALRLHSDPSSDHMTKGVNVFF